MLVEHEYWKKIHENSYQRREKVNQQIRIKESNMTYFVKNLAFMHYNLDTNVVNGHRSYELHA